MSQESRLYTGDPRFTVYPEANHNSWTAAFNDPELYAWLAEQRRPEPSPVSG